MLQKDVSSGMLAGLGLGYQFNNWFRADVTGEYRGGTTFRGLDTYPARRSNDYHGTKSEWLFLANAYIDLGTWWCVTPFIGAGIGYSQNTIDNWRDVNSQYRRDGLCRQELAMGDGLGAARRSRLQGDAELHRGIRLSLRQSRRFRIG